MLVGTAVVVPPFHPYLGDKATDCTAFVCCYSIHVIDAHDSMTWNLEYKTKETGDDYILPADESRKRCKIHQDSYDADHSDKPNLEN